MTDSAASASPEQANEHELPGNFRRAFWFAYAAHFAMTLAATMFYRSADFVAIMGGDDFDLGWIVGCGVVGGLAMRAFQAVASDAYGSKPIWITSCFAVTLACVAHVFVPVGQLVWLYPARFVFQGAVNGFFGASITFMSSRAPASRTAEVVGNLGTAGFLGMVVGPQILDQIWSVHAWNDHERMKAALWLATGTSFLSGIGAILSTAGHESPRRRHAPVLAVIRRYHPGLILLVAAATGLGLGLPGTFLRPYLETRHIEGIGLFFVVYPMTAFVTRLSIRRFPERYGVRPLVLVGLTSLICGTLAFLAVASPWQVAWPALFLGIAHAVLFPVVIAGGTLGYPQKFRGLGTALVLAAFDAGSLVGMPAAGSILRGAGVLNWPRYPTMFISITLTFVVIAMWYWLAATRSGERVASERG